MLWNGAVDLVPKADVRQVLDFLVARNVRIAAISNAIFSSRCMISELARHGLDGYFEFVISSADHGARKPSKSIFELALKSLDMEPHDVWYVGDRWDADVLGATAAKMKAVWFADGFHEHDASIAHIKLQRWTDFEDLWKRHA